MVILKKLKIIVNIFFPSLLLVCMYSFFNLKLFDIYFSIYAVFTILILVALYVLVIIYITANHFSNVCWFLLLFCFKESCSILKQIRMLKTLQTLTGISSPKQDLSYFFLFSFLLFQLWVFSGCSVGKKYIIICNNTNNGWGK